MRTIRVMADLRVDDIDFARTFYQDYLALRTEEFNLGWVARYSSPETGAVVQLLTGDLTAPADPATSVHTTDVVTAYQDALARDYEIVHPLTRERWGVHRFFVRAPDGTIVNMVGHRD